MTIKTYRILFNVLDVALFAVGIPLLGMILAERCIDRYPFLTVCLTPVFVLPFVCAPLEALCCRMIFGKEAFEQHIRG